MSVTVGDVAGKGSPAALLMALLLAMMRTLVGGPFDRYEVNVLVTHGSSEGAPVVVERNPNYYNLIGRIDYVSQMGTMVTDHTMIKPGSLLQANGGFIVIRIRDLLTQPQAYEGLKRALDQHAVAIENLNEALGIIPTSGLRPEPIPLDVKIAIVGDSGLHAALYRYDPDFREHFRVKADFDTEFDRTPDNVLGRSSSATL